MLSEHEAALAVGLDWHGTGAPIAEMEVFPHHLSDESVVESLANDLLGSLLNLDAASDDLVRGQQFGGYFLYGVLLLVDELSFSLSSSYLVRRFYGLSYELPDQLTGDMEPLGYILLQCEGLIDCLYNGHNFAVT